MKAKLKKTDWDTIRAFLTMLNVILIIQYGVSIAWLGLIIALFGIAKDICHKKLNGFIIHVSNAILNLYFILGVR